MADWVEEQIVKHEWTGNVDNISYGQILVRCKDCKKRNDIEKCPVRRAIAHITMNVEMPDNINPTKNGNWFCADGER